MKLTAMRVNDNKSVEFDLLDIGNKYVDDDVLYVNGTGPVIISSIGLADAKQESPRVNRTLKQRIWPSLAIQCDFCGKIDVYTLDLEAKEISESDRNAYLSRLHGWTINEHGAVKCPPCNWKK